MALLVLLALPAQAVLFFSTADPDHNTTAPEGELSGSGWQWQGRWGDFLGTPVGPRYFLTAKHVGGSTHQLFTFRGRAYGVLAGIASPDCDFMMWRVAGVFPGFAPIYHGSDETSRECVVIGRGTQRGALVTVTNGMKVLSRGWRSGPADGRQRWGRNVVTGVSDGGAGVGELLQAAFDAEGVPDECHLTIGDSGGSMFLNDGTGWKLAGIHYAVDGPFSYAGDAADTGFLASLHEMEGLFLQEGTNWVEVRPEGRPQPSSLYSTRVSVHAAWIQSVLETPLPEQERLKLMVAGVPEGPYAEADGYTVDEVERCVTIPAPDRTLFYSLQAPFMTRITRIGQEGALLVLGFE